MSSSRLTVVVGLACAVLGLGAGVALSRAPAPQPASAASPSLAADPPAAGSRDVVVVGPTTARLDERDKQALRDIVREELSTERAAAAASASAGAASNEAPQWQLSSEAMKTYDDVRVCVDDAVARGTWTDDDRAALRPSLAQLPAEARIEAVRPLLIAVNQGKVHFAGHGSLL